MINLTNFFIRKKLGFFVPQRLSIFTFANSFSEAKVNSDDTFLLVMKRLQQKADQSRKIEKLLIDSANDSSIRINPQAMRMQLNKMAPIVAIHEQLAPIQDNLRDIEQMLKQTQDAEERAILQQEVQTLHHKKQDLKQTALDLLIPSDAYDDVSEVYLQFRPGAGGSQSAVFVEDISEMFTSYAQNRGWRISTISSIKQTVASRGYKYLKLKVHGDQCYKVMKCEAGVHKVIRVPQTQSKGRLHSSTISMVVMPSLPFNFVIDPKDIKYQFTRSSGAGGQSVNKTDSACRATYAPTGLSVFIQEQRCQDQNKKRATQLLKQRLFEMEYKKTVDQEMKRRKVQIGTMDRSQKIRTYNYPQDRITDHRTGLTLFGMSNMMGGNLLQKFIDSYMDKIYQEKLNLLLEDLKQDKKGEGKI